MVKYIQLPEHEITSGTKTTKHLCHPLYWIYEFHFLQSTPLRSSQF